MGPLETSSGRVPLVSIGLPVYNVQRFLRRALDSLLNQTFTDFELIISDNASTDDTGSICEEYARRDPRIRYIRQNKNIGAPQNWNAVFEPARGEFFKWASGNDYCAVTYLERCLAALRDHPDAVLCYGRTALIDDDGKQLGVYDGDLDVPDESGARRYMRVRGKWALNNAQQGVIRSSVLRKTGGDRLYPAGDMILSAELALYGKFLLLPDVLLYRRQGPSSMTNQRTPEQIQRLFRPNSRRPMHVVEGRAVFDYYVSIGRAPLPLPDKLLAWADTTRRALRVRHTLWKEAISVIRKPM